MGKFNKSGGREMPELNTSSLPDLVFAFLFFIMMVTTIREVTPKVSYNNLPKATELTKLEEKSLVTFVYIGKPNEAYQTMYGTKPCIQLMIRLRKIRVLYIRTLNKRKARLKMSAKSL